jgi:hypothetical protein
MVVLIMLPPLSTSSPPALTVVLTMVPPLSTSYSSPELMVTPLDVTLLPMVVVVMLSGLSCIKSLLADSDP